MFHFHSLLIYFSIYIVTSEGFSQFCNSHVYLILLACASSVIFAIPSLLDIYTIDAHSIYFQFCNLNALPSLLEQCYILIQYLCVNCSSKVLVLFLVSFNVYVTPSFKVYYCDKFDKFVLFLNILTDYFTVSYCIVFLFLYI